MWDKQQIFLEVIKNLPEDFYDIYLINLIKGRGVVPLGRLMGSKSEVRITTIINKDLKLIEVNTDH